jgi:Family of unknown function (DUF6370)
VPKGKAIFSYIFFCLSTGVDCGQAGAGSGQLYIYSVTLFHYSVKTVFMKSVITILLCLLLLHNASAQDTAAKAGMPDPAKKMLMVEASCGMCKFGMKGGDCALAVRFGGKSYYVDGADIDHYGDAHAADGFCNAIRRAKVQGEVVDGRFKASYFKLVAAAATKKLKKKKSTSG